MVTPFPKFQKIEDIVPLMDKEERLLYPLVDNTIMVLNKIINPYEEYVPLFDKNEATIVALYIKQTKLLKDFYCSYKANNIHICLLLCRVIYEAYIKMSYLIIHGEEAQKEYRLCSFKDRYRFYKNSKDKENGYFTIRNKKFLEDLKSEGFKLEDLETARKSFGGKNMRQLIEEIEGEGLYNSLYAIMSDSIHSDWGETRQLYLKKQEEKDMYYPNDNEMSHGRLLVPTIQVAIDSSFKYIEWIKHDSYQYEHIVLYQPLLTEVNRMFQLIGDYYMYTYMNDSEKYLYN